MKSVSERILDCHSFSVAFYSAGLVQAYLAILAIDSMFAYRVGIWLASPIIRGGVLLILAIVLAQRVYSRGIRYDALLLTFLAYILVSGGLGIWTHGLNYIVGRHLFAAGAMFFSYWLGLYFKDEISLPSNSAAFRHVAYLTAICALIFVGVAAYHGYLGLPFTSLNGSLPLLFSLDVALLGGQWWLVAICLIVILITNLRSGVIGASIMGASYLTFRFTNRKSLALLAPFLAILFFVICTAAIIAVNNFLPEIGISERARRTIEGIAGLWGNSNLSMSEIFERLTTHRLSQAVAVWDSVSGTVLSTLFGGFGNEYTWQYYSELEKGWQRYTLHQSDTMTSYFLLTGGAVFATGLTALILWRCALVYTNMLYGPRLGSLFVLGFGASMFFGFQPNVPLFWICLAALSCKRQNSQSEATSIV